MKNFLYDRECNNTLNRTRGQILLKVYRIIQDNLFFISSFSRRDAEPTFLFVYLHIVKACLLQIRL